MKKLKMTGTIIILAVCLSFAGTGCDMDSAQRIAIVKSVIDTTNEANQSLNASVGEIDRNIALLEQMLNDPNIPPESKPKILDSLSAARIKLNALMMQKQKADAILAQAKMTLDSINPADVNELTEFDAYGKVTRDAGMAIGGNTGGYIYLAGVLIPVVGGLLTQIFRLANKNKKQNQSIDKLKTAATDLVVSNDVLLNPQKNDGIIPADKVEAAKTLLKNTLLDTTSALVDDIHNFMKYTGPK